jgi:uncharacterized membrane protein
MWYVNTDSSVAIDAPAAVVWDVFVETERWHEWTASITSITPLDGPAIEVGNRFEIKQPRFPKLVWEVTEVDPGRSWTWAQRSPGGTTYATHVVRDQGDGRAVVEQRIDQRGPIGSLVGVLSRGLTRKYLDLEGQGLKRRSEQRAAAA